MIGRLLNLPFKVLGKAARTLQDRNDAVMKERHGTGDASTSFEFLRDLPEVETPPGFDPATLDRTSDRVKVLVGERQVCFVDLRDAAAFAAGHVEGALNMPRGELNIRISEIPPDAAVVTYADTIERARRGALFCRDRGLDDAWALTGGFEAWKAAGGRMSRG